MATDPQTEPLSSRRVVTLLFSDLCDSTRIAGEMDAEAYGELIDSIRHACAPLISAHGGRVHEYYGDGALIIFGLDGPVATEVTHAIDAALEIHATVRRLPPPPGCPRALRLHSGVHTGLVFVRKSPAGQTEVVGQPLNVAARLASAARADEILVSEQSLGPARRRFRTGAARQVALDRYSGEVAALPVLRPAAADGSEHAAPVADAGRQFPFVGRSAELAQLRACLDESAAGRSQCVTIVAPAGQGKTRLSERLAATASRSGFDVFHGSCAIGPVAQVLRPFRQIAAEMARHAPADDLAAPFRTFLAQTGGAALAEDAAPDAFFLAGVTRWTAKRPLLLVCDDLHSADSASLRLLTMLTATTGRLLVLLLARDTGLAGPRPEQGTVLPLQPLDPDESSELARHLIPDLDPLEAAKVHARAGGNPLFIEEICHLEGRSVAVRPPEFGHEQAGWLAGLIGSRFALLPAADAALLQAAAVIGDAFPVRLLEEVADVGLDRLTDLVARDFLLPDQRGGWMRFKHGIAWEVVYSLVPLRTRKLLHARIAEMLEQRAEAYGIERNEALAWHYAASEQSPKAADAAERAGDAAAQLGAIDRAQFQYQAALKALDQPTAMSDADYQRWSGLVARFGIVSVFDAEPGHLEVFERAVALAEERRDERGAAQANFWAAYLCYALGEGRKSLEFGRRALAGARQLGDQPFVVQVQSTLGQAEALVCNYPRALELLDAAIGVKRHHRSGRQASLGLAYSLTSKASVVGDLGRFDEAMAILEEALAAVAGAAHPVEASINNWGGAIRLWQGRPADALELAARASSVAERVQSVYNHAMSRAIAGYADWLMTGSDDAVAKLDDAVACMMQRGKNLVVSLAHGWLAHAQAERANVAATRAAVGHALARARAGDRLGEAMAARAAARMYMRDNPRRAMRWLKRARRVASLRQSPHEAAANDLLQAELDRAIGLPVSALLDRAEAAFSSMGMKRHLERCARLRAECLG